MTNLRIAGLSRERMSKQYWRPRQLKTKRVALKFLFQAMAL